MVALDEEVDEKKKQSNLLTIENAENKNQSQSVVFESKKDSGLKAVSKMRESDGAFHVKISRLDSHDGQSVMNQSACDKT